ncbi:MAG: preprotein translocase subunit YajC [Gemmatimonadota bacterium]
MTVLLVQILAIGAVFYFFIIRPQSAARKKAEEMLGALKKGDDVTTAGGIVGRVVSVKENLITIESGSASLVVERARIVRVGSQSAPGAAV